MSKAKYIGITVLITAAAAIAFFTAYKLFSGTPKIIVGDVAYDDGPKTRGTAYEQFDAEDKSGEPPAEKPETAEASAIADKINEDTIIVYEYYYEDGDKTEKAEQKAPPALLNLTRGQLASRIEGFSVVSFSTKEVVLRKKIAHSKNERYILGIWEGRVAVFYGGSGINQNGLKEVTDTPAATLSQDEQELLKNGVVIEGDSELMKVLEDYGS